MNAWLEQLDKAFILCIGCNAVTSLLLYFGKLDSGSYTIITCGTTGAYITAWCAGKIKGTPTERGAAQAQQPG